MEKTFSLGKFYHKHFVVWKLQRIFAVYFTKDYKNT